MDLVQRVYGEPGKKEILPVLESVLTKNLDQAVKFVCLTGLAEKLLKQEETSRAKVSLIYLVTRAMFNESRRPDKKESEQLWMNIWSFASQIPTVATEMEEQQKLGNLKGWQSEVQIYALRRWRTLKNEQMPRVKNQIKDLENRVQAFLNINPKPE